MLVFLGMHKTKIGVFASKEILLDLYTAASSNKLIIFFHGCCGTVYDTNPTTYQLLADKLVATNTANVGFYESTRRLRKTEDTEEMDFFQFASEAFGGKSFIDEVEEGRRSVKYLLDEYRKQKQTAPELYFAGFSLGGLIAATLTQEFKAKGTMLFGSASKFAVMDNLPILGSAAEMKAVATISETAAKSIATPVLLIRGTDDDTASHADALQLFSAFKKAKVKTFIEWQGIDHRFKLNRGEPDSALIDRLAAEISRFINSV